MVISKRQALLRKPWRELTTRTTELGVEKLYPGCLQWWPQDEEFFSFISTRCHFHNECRACRAAAQARRRQSRIAALTDVSTGGIGMDVLKIAKQALSN
ncbi:TPA: hypothetical protein ACGCBD_002739 [Pseudomonas aeruginosa]